MEKLPPCPACSSVYTYEMDEQLVCPECSFEWTPESDNEESLEVKDANGNLLADGDSVVVIKNLPVKGSSQPIKPAPK